MAREGKGEGAVEVCRVADETEPPEGGICNEGIRVIVVQCHRMFKPVLTGLPDRLELVLTLALVHTLAEPEREVGEGEIVCYQHQQYLQHNNSYNINNICNITTVTSSTISATLQQLQHQQYLQHYNGYNINNICNITMVTTSTISATLQQLQHQQYLQHYNGYNINNISNLTTFTTSTILATLATSATTTDLCRMVCTFPFK